jgi:hypothetical protein
MAALKEGFAIFSMTDFICRKTQFPRKKNLLKCRSISFLLLSWIILLLVNTAQAQMTSALSAADGGSQRSAALLVEKQRLEVS